MAHDPKGLYKRAFEGQLKQLINYLFDDPRSQERKNYVNTVSQNVDECYQAILEVAKTHLTDFAI
mgnify:CR=1 FL=1